MEVIKPLKVLLPPCLKQRKGSGKSGCSVILFISACRNPDIVTRLDEIDWFCNLDPMLKVALIF